MTQRKQIKLGLSMRGYGYHAAAWRHPDAPRAATLDINYYANNARIAERGKFDMVFLADGIGIRGKNEPEGALCRSSQNVELEPLTLLSAVSVLTSHIGVVATASTTYNEPYHIARKFASLDHISGGRAGWNIVTSWSEAEARNFNREQHMAHGARYARAAEFVDVVTGLWDSFEPGAVVQDKASGIFYDPARMHVLDHRGAHFAVRGPLSSTRTPQGRPILVQAGASAAGMDIAAANADVVYAAAHTLPMGQSYYSELKGKLAAHGRTPDELLIMPGITPFVGRTEQEAQDHYGELQDLIDPILGLSYIYGQMGNLSGYDLDGPVPEPKDHMVRSMAQGLLKLARRDNLTIRQLYLMVAAGFGGRVIVGSAQQVADDLEEWASSGAADGFNICPGTLPGGAAAFVDLVVPELQRRGLFRTEYESNTLRGNLGLAMPRNRYTARKAGEGSALDPLGPAAPDPDSSK
jgi:FMN-dependent oxidoreductase (nitrilotriacetate monooxygenase family)